MTAGLHRLVAGLAEGRLDEAALYRMERAHRPPPGGKVAPGLLACPICGATALRFLRFGLAGRRNAQCPSCGSLERHRFLWLYLQRRTPLFRRPLRLLHTAPEPALEARLRPLPHLRYTSVDRFDPAADVQADLTDLPFAAASFDALLSCHVLEHVADDRAALAELARVIRPGGWGVLMVPFDPRLPATLEDPANDTPARRMAAYGHPYHHRIYGADLVGRLAAAGFAAEIVTTRAFLTPHARRRWRINRNNLLLLKRGR